MKQPPDWFETRLELLLVHCRQQEAFATKALTNLQTRAAIYQRQRDRLSLEVTEGSPRWNQLLDTQVAAIEQLNQLNQIKIEALLARQAAEMQASDEQTNLRQPPKREWNSKGLLSGLRAVLTYSQ